MYRKINDSIQSLLLFYFSVIVPNDYIVSALLLLLLIGLVPLFFSRKVVFIELNNLRIALILCFMSYFISLLLLINVPRYLDLQ